MTKRVIAQTFIWIIVLGSLLASVHVLGLGEISIIYKETRYIFGWQWNFYKIDLFQYIKNLQQSIDATNLPNILPRQPSLPSWPNLNWTEITELLDNILSVLKMIAKYILTGINYIIYGFSIIFIVPLKALMYPLRIIFSILGLNTSQQDFIRIINTIANLNIPYIPITF